MKRREELTKGERKAAEAAALAAKLPSAKSKKKPRNHKHPVLGAISKLSDLPLLPSTVAASAALLQPDALLARGGSVSGNRFPGGGDPTATVVTRAYSAVSVAAQTQELWYVLGMHTHLGYVFLDEFTADPHVAVVKYVFGSVLRLTAPIATTITWPSFATSYVLGTNPAAYVMVLPWNSTDTATHTISALQYTDGAEIWQSINAIDVDGVPLLEETDPIPRMKVRKTGGDLLFEAAPTLETSCIASVFTTQTGASGVGHSELNLAGLRAAARTFDYKVVNMESPGFNARYVGPTAVNTLYDPFYTNMTFEDADEDDVTEVTLEARLAAYEKDFVKRFAACCTPQGVKLAAFVPFTNQLMGPDQTDSPPDVPETITCVYLHNSGPAFDAAVTSAFSYEFTPPLGGGYETKAIQPDPNWAVVLEVSHTEVPILVGPHSFGDFFGSLWNGVKAVASEAWGITKDLAKSAAQGAGAALVHG